jgi:hypothetical protein
MKKGDAGRAEQPATRASNPTFPNGEVRVTFPP